MKKDSILWLWIVFLGVPVLANSLAVLFLVVLITPLTATENFFGDLRRERSLVSLYMDLAPFVFAITLVLVYARPVFREWKNFSNKSEMSILARRRLMNAPVFVGLFALSGWLFAAVNSNLLLLSLGRKPDAWWFVFSGLLNLFTGTMTFLVTYYVLERLRSTRFVELLFPGGDLIDLPGLVHVSVRGRFLIFYLSAGFLPVFILSDALFIQMRAAAGSVSFIPPVLFLIFVTVAVFLTINLSSSFYAPLREMRLAAQKIETGNLNVSIRITSGDELGELGVGFNRMAAGLREKEKIKADFGRAVDPKIRDYLLEHGSELGGQQRVASVLFCDLRAFTAFAEGREPRQVVAVLNRYFEQMHVAVEEYEGVVNKFIGDAVLALFGTPIPDERHAERAVRAGLEMLYRRDELNAALVREGLPALRSGIGVHTGELLAGNLGSARRLEYTVIGDTVNLASRIESLCKKMNREFIISEATRSALPENLARYFVYLARVRVKGRQESVPVYGYQQSGV